MSSHCWIALAVLSALAVLASTHRGRGGNEPGKFGGGRAPGNYRGRLGPGVWKGGYGGGGWKGGHGRGRGGFRPGGWGHGGDWKKDSCRGLYTDLCGTNSTAQNSTGGGRSRKGSFSKEARFNFSSCFDPCEADDLCLVKFVGPAKRGRVSSGKGCPLCTAGCPAGTTCAEDLTYCDNNPENAICKFSESKTSFNATMSRCLPGIASTVSPTVAAVPSAA